jgi:hypothetical protein
MVRQKLIIFFIFLAVSSSGFSCDSLEELRSKYSIQNETLQAGSGKKYQRCTFESRLHFDLFYYMKDVKAAEVVYKSYKKHIFPVIIDLVEEGTSNKGYFAFSKALIETCLLFGNPNYSPEESFLCALRHKGSYGLQWIKEHGEAVQSFIKDANVPIYTLPSKKKSGNFKVVIVTTTASGGNYSVAKSMTDFLKKTPGIEPILIDVEDVAREVDPIMLATNTYTYDMIYSSIFQKTNNFNVIPDRKKLNREVQQYIPSNILAVLKKKIIKIHPDLIISIRAYTCDDIGLASLGIPFRMLHTDFELCPSLAAYYRSTSIESIQFWLPICRPSLFKPLFEEYKQLNSYSDSDEYPAIIQKMSNFLKVPKEDLKAHFELIGCPSLDFFRIEDSLSLKKLKEKWRVKEEELPVFIVMGKHGTDSLKKIFSELSSVKGKLPLKYIFICGKNKALKEELTQKVNVLGREDFMIEGLLSPDEMNEIMNISLLGISKAGGATVIESLAVKRHLLLMDSYPWEEVNASFLIESGLGTKYDSSKDLIKQIEKCVQKQMEKGDRSISLEDWQGNLLREIEKCRR